MGGSIVDDPTPEKPAEDEVTLTQLADMLYLVFEAVKDLEAQFKEFTDVKKS